MSPARQNPARAQREHASAIDGRRRERTLQSAGHDGVLHVTVRVALSPQPRAARQIDRGHDLQVVSAAVDEDPPGGDHRRGVAVADLHPPGAGEGIGPRPPALARPTRSRRARGRATRATPGPDPRSQSPRGASASVRFTGRLAGTGLSVERDSAARGRCRSGCPPGRRINAAPRARRAGAARGAPESGTARRAQQSGTGNEPAVVRDLVGG